MALLGETSIEEPAACLDSAAEIILNSLRKAALELALRCYGMVYFFFFVIFHSSSPPAREQKAGIQHFLGKWKCGQVSVCFSRMWFSPVPTVLWFVHAGIDAGRVDVQRQISNIGSQISLMLSVFPVLLCIVAGLLPFCLCAPRAATDATSI